MVCKIGMREIKRSERSCKKTAVQSVEQHIFKHGRIDACLKTVLFYSQSFSQKSCLSNKHQAEKNFNESLFLQVF